MEYTSRRSCLRSVQILVFLEYQTRFFVIIIFRQDSSREERNKILACYSGKTQSCLIDQINKNQVRIARYSRFFEIQTRILFLSFRKESCLKFKIRWILSDSSEKYESGMNCKTFQISWNSDKFLFSFPFNDSYPILKKTITWCFLYIYL